MPGVSSYPGVIMAVATDAGILLTTDEAAERFGVKPGTIRQWVRRGHLAPIGRAPAGGTAYYRYVDVARAEQKTRERARRDLAAFFARSAA